MHSSIENPRRNKQNKLFIAAVFEAQLSQQLSVVSTNLNIFPKYLMTTFDGLFIIARIGYIYRQ